MLKLGKRYRKDSRGQYNPYLTPPDIQQAEYHYQCQRLGRLQSNFQRQDYCQCCFQQPIKESLSLFEDIEELIAINPSLFTFFFVLKTIGFLLLIHLLIYGVPLALFTGFPEIQILRGIQIDQSTLTLSPGDKFLL